MWVKHVIQRFDVAEAGVCLAFNRGSYTSSVQRFFRLISRLGDGVFWYVLIAALPAVYGAAGVLPAIQMVFAGAAGLVIYKYLKERLVRERPFVSHGSIRCSAPPMDRYSFPSGHTLHAVSFCIIVTSHFPMLAWLVVPFATLVALSRVILGLHYPSDVIAGAVIGVLLSLMSFQLA